MHATYGDRVEFLFVYIREAHALDGAMPKGGLDGHPLVEEPASLLERKEIAHTCSERLDMAPMTVLVDDMKDSTCRAYAAFPDRLYLVGKDGKIAYAGAQGPPGFRPLELEDAIRKELGMEPLERPPGEGARPSRRGRGRGDGGGGGDGGE